MPANGQDTNANAARYREATGYTVLPIDRQLAYILSMLPNVSERDGPQSLAGNQIPTSDLERQMYAQDPLAVAVNYAGGKYSAAEAWGGGQFRQPAMFLLEDPLDNLRRLHAAAPNVPLKMLLRGRQGVAFDPNSESMLFSTLRLAERYGITEIRAFDSQNDRNGLKGFFSALRRYREKYPNSKLIIDGAIAYNSPPPNGKPAMTLDDYAEFGLWMAMQGADKITIKNYAGVRPDQMPPLIQKLQARLSTATRAGQLINEKGELRKVPVGLHIHGDHLEMTLQVIGMGVPVDGADAEYSGSPSHISRRKVIYAWMQKHGYSPAQVDSRPIMKILGQYEAVITEVMTRGREKTLPDGSTVTESFQDRSQRLRAIPQERIEATRYAGGAWSDLDGRVQKLWPGIAKMRQTIAASGGPDDPRLASLPSSAAELSQQMEDEINTLSQRIGDPNTVTPGALTLTDQVSALTVARLFNKPRNMTMYQGRFIDFASWRYGELKGPIDVKFRDALMMYRALTILEEAIDKHQAAASDAAILAYHANIGSERLRLPMEVNNGVISGIKLDDPQLEAALMATPIQQFINAVGRMSFTTSVPQAVREKMLQAVTLGGFPDPKEGPLAGLAVVRQLIKEGVRLPMAPSEAAWEVMALRSRSNGVIDDSVAIKMLRHQSELKFGKPVPKTLGTNGQTPGYPVQDVTPSAPLPAPLPAPLNGHGPNGKPNGTGHPPPAPLTPPGVLPLPPEPAKPHVGRPR